MPADVNAVRRLREVASRPRFSSSRAPYVIVDRDFVIHGVNPAYQRATRRWREELYERYLFDAFPDNPDDADANGVSSLGSSLERVLQRGVLDRMPRQRYDIPHPADHRRFVEKVWLPVNTPILDDGRVIGVLHHVEDVTHLDRREPAPEPAPGADGAVGLAQAYAQVRGELHAAQQQVENLNVALQSSRDIGAAVGILMSEYRVDRDAAFELLRSASMHTNRKVRDLALDVIDRGSLPALRHRRRNP